MNVVSSTTRRSCRAVFIGHYAASFGAKSVAPRVSLATLFVAAQLADIVFSVLLVADVERVTIDPEGVGPSAVSMTFTPFSHGLIGTLILALVAGLAYWRWSRTIASRTGTAAAVVGATVASHYLLDLVSHDRDISLVDGVTAGIGLGQSGLVAFIVEGMLLIAGLSVYLHRTTARDAIGSWGPAAFVAGLLGFGWLVLVVMSPAADVAGLAASNLAAYLLLSVVAGWIDRHRHPRAGRYACAPGAEPL